VDGTLVFLSAQLQSFRDVEVPMVVAENQPLIMDVSSQADIARQILSAPLQLSLANAAQGDPGPWIFEPSVVSGLLTVKRVDNGGQPEVHVGLESGAFAQLLIPIAGQVDRKAKNARFEFNDTTRQLDLKEYSAVGRTTDVLATITFINDALMRGEHSVALVVKEEQPAVPATATAESLGIREKIMEQTTYFYGSDPARLQNIKAAAAQFHGVFVAPGATFSMGEILSDITLDNGFTEAWIIYNGRTIKGVGGGVCQVSTTLFRTALYAGFPIVQRVPHAYRVSYYERTAGGGRDPKLAGMDATVYFPLVDFQFVNDTPYWLLMETYLTDTSLTWKFYSTYDGRTVNVESTGPTNIVPAPQPLFEVNPDFTKGQIKQVDWAADGSDVIITQTVWKDGVIYFTRIFTTHYEPWQAVCQYGPDTEDVEKLAKKKGLCQPPGT
jgi:vancomycin resistance protein YoaR